MTRASSLAQSTRRDVLAGPMAPVTYRAGAFFATGLATFFTMGCVWRFVECLVMGIEAFVIVALPELEGCALE